MTTCTCAHPRPMAAFCGRCYHQIVTVERTTHRPPSASAVPVMTAPETSVHVSGAPFDPWESDPLPAFNDLEAERITAIFDKRTGR